MSDGLREVIESAMRDTESSVETPTDQTSNIDTSTQNEPAVETPKQENLSSDRARDEKGRFAAKTEDKSQTAQPEVQTSVTQQNEKITVSNTTAAVTASTIAPPAAWSGKIKAEVWPKLPPEAKEEIHRVAKALDSEFHRKSQELSELRRNSEWVDKAIAPHRQKMEAIGLAPVEAVSRLLEAQENLDRDPVGGIRKLITGYGITPEQLFNSDTNTKQQDPAITQMRAELAELRAERQRDDQARKARMQNAIQSEIDSFENETDANGNLIRPYFNDLIREIVPIAQLIKDQKPNATAREILSEAYERTMWANPELRKTLLQTNQAESQAKQVEAEKAKADKAKKMGSSLAGAPGGAAIKQAPSSVRDAIIQAMESGA